MDVRHSGHLEKSQLTVTPPVSGGKPIFALAVKDQTKLFTYSFHRKVSFVSSFGCDDYLLFVNSYASMIFRHQHWPILSFQFQAQLTTFKHVLFNRVSLFLRVILFKLTFSSCLACLALGVDTGNIGILDLSSSSASSSLSFLWQSIPADVYRLAWHSLREGRVAYSTRLGHLGLYDTLTGRSRVVYDFRYNQLGSPTTVLWGPLVPNATDDSSLAILYTVGDGKLHRWDSPEKTCVPTDLTSLVQGVRGLKCRDQHSTDICHF